MGVRVGWGVGVEVGGWKWGLGKIVGEQEEKQGCCIDAALVMKMLCIASAVHASLHQSRRLSWHSDQMPYRHTGERDCTPQHCC